MVEASQEYGALDVLVPPNIVPEDTKYLGDRLDAMVDLLINIRDSLVGVDPNGRLINLGPGQANANGWQQQVRYRTTFCIVSGGVAGDRFRITIGTAAQFEFVNKTGAIAGFPLPFVIEPGVPVTAQDVTTPNDTTWTLSLIVVPEGVTRGAA